MSSALNFILTGTAGDEFVRAGVRAAARHALAGAREESDVSRAELVIRTDTDLSDPEALRTPSEPRQFIALSARISAPPDAESLAALRELAPAWRLITVQDRIARDVLASVGIDAPLLPCAALHAWRLHPPTVLEPHPRRVALSAGLGELTGVLASALLARELEPVLVGGETDWFRQHGQFRGGITDRVDTAMLLAGRGAPAITIGDDTRAMEEAVLPGYRASEADPGAIVALLCSLLDDPATHDRLIKLEQRSFRAHCDAVRNALGQPDAAEALGECLDAIRRRLSAGNDRGTPAPQQLTVVDAAPLLALDAEEFVREAYVRLFGRFPEPEGLRHWTSVLANGTGKQQCLEALASSDEARNRGVRMTGWPQSTEDFLRDISLGCISTDSLRRWTELIDTGKLSRDEAARLIADSTPPARMLAAVANLRRERELYLPASGS